MSEFTEISRRHMMGSTASHQMGDLSREEFDLCVVYGDEGENWIGEWVTGFGFFNVRFPKKTTRDLTEAEIKKFDGKQLSINGTPIAPIKIISTN